ncbi:TRAP transporter small permease [Oceanobacillus sp. Castelsardo]|uniref:TRAP transporter small permease n=1 Tax=Oceanobacillus sp. Castelsardo TaxID=1851204 RepID=UPI00083825CC|nr:TRAP transporter small permease [Oceanobacillus sp. Castelsardo]
MGQQLNKEKQLNVAINQEPGLAKFTRVLGKVTISLNNVLHKISSVLLMALMFLTTADVAGRFFFKSPIIGTYELTGLLLALMIFYSLGAGQLKKNHIEIDFFTKKMSNKSQHILYSLSSFVLFILLCLTTWQLYEYSVRVWIGGETSGDLGLPLYIFSGLTIIGAFSFALTLLLDGFNSLLKAVNPDES